MSTLGTPTARKLATAAIATKMSWLSVRNFRETLRAPVVNMMEKTAIPSPASGAGMLRLGAFWSKASCIEVRNETMSRHAAARRERCSSGITIKVRPAARAPRVEKCLGDLLLRSVLFRPTYPLLLLLLLFHA